MRLGVIGVESHSSFRQAERLSVILLGHAVVMILGSKSAVVCIQARERLPISALKVSRLQSRGHDSDDRLDDFILNLEHISEMMIESLSPDLLSACGIDKLSSHTDAVSSFSDAAICDVAHP